MKIILFKFIFLTFLPLACLGQSRNELIVCGDNQVTIFDVNQSRDTIPHITWQWQADDASTLPDEYRNQYFQSIDECKPVASGTQLLITSSAGGVALIDIASKNITFYALVGNAHSAELLPNNRIAVMSSTHDQGNRIVLFDIERPETPIFHDSIYSGHGVIWDNKDELLYALGYDELRAYDLKDWNTESPSLEIIKSWKIPGESGHDLSNWSRDHNKLILTEHESVWLFDKSTHKFKPFVPLRARENVKAISHHPSTHRMAYIQAEISWWSHRVYLTDPDQWFSFPGIKLYKVRWMSGS
jgi:hypothetical protein